MNVRKKSSNELAACSNDLSLKGKEETKVEKIELEAREVFYGAMAFWKEIKEASTYCVSLFMKNRNEIIRIAQVNVEKNMCYHTFQGLGAGQYYINVKAYKDNNIVAQSEDIKANVHTIYRLLPPSM